MLLILKNDERAVDLILGTKYLDVLIYGDNWLLTKIGIFCLNYVTFIIIILVTSNSGRI